jgi:hypothetical protein
MTKLNKLSKKAKRHVRKTTGLLKKASEEIQQAATAANADQQLSIVEQVGETQAEARSELEQALEAAENIIEEREYSSHRDQILGAQPSEERIEKLTKCLVEAFSSVITYRQVPFIVFDDLNVDELANAFINYPIIIKPILTCVNVAQRAIKRDLGFDYNSYSGKISEVKAHQLAAYIKPLLPPAIAIPALMELDRFFWADKYIRAKKGNWEKSVTEAINKQSSKTFRKRRFKCDGEEFEIDAAFPPTGNIDVAIDVKRIESPRDIHKRADEIINKATKFKKTYPKGTFVAVVYYPFPNQHINLQSRLHSPYINEIFFAGETPSSISNAADMLVGKFGLKKKSLVVSK